MPAKLPDLSVAVNTTLTAPHAGHAFIYVKNTAGAPITITASAGTVFTGGGTTFSLGAGRECRFAFNGGCASQWTPFVTG